MNLQVPEFYTQYTESRHSGKSCGSATIDPMQTFTGYSLIRVAHVLFGDHYRLACFSSFNGFGNMAAHEPRSSQNVNPDPLPRVTFWKQSFTFEII